MLKTPKGVQSDKSLRICPYRVIDAAKSCLHGAIDPKSRYAKRGARPVGIYVLQPAGIGWLDCLGGNANLAHGKGLYQHPGHSFGGADRWLEVGRRCGTPVGGRIFLQLWHVGRISHSSLLPGNASPVAPSAIRARAQTVIETGFVDVSEPRALSLTKIRRTIEDYGRAASNAKAAGFDGVEIHAANGYLIDQFLRSKSNVRTDTYGGSAANRARFLGEVVEAVLNVWEPGRVGVRISPLGTFNDMGDANPEETFACVVDVLNGHRPGYLHVVEDAIPVDCKADFFRRLRSAWKGIYVANGGYDAERGERAVSEGSADAVAYGRLFLANPDLPTRLSRRGPLNVPDTKSFYGGDERGYIDYPEWTRAERE